MVPIGSDKHQEMVLVRDIPFYSICEHHLVPFFGVAHVAYIPSKNGKIAGLSKLVRLVRAAAARLQLQERLTSTIADTLVETLEPEGVLVLDPGRAPLHVYAGRARRPGRGWSPPRCGASSAPTRPPGPRSWP